mgnify:FL=1
MVSTTPFEDSYSKAEPPVSQHIMPSLLQINVTANWGSHGRIAEEIGRLAISEGWESFIAYGRGEPSSESNLIKIGGKESMYINALKARLFDNEGLNAKADTERLIKEIDRIKPDIVHLHNIHGYYLHYPTLFNYLKDKNLPTVWTLHDCWTFTGHCSHFELVGCEKWKSGCHGCPQLKEYPKSFGFDGSERNYWLKKEYFTSLQRLTLVPVSEWLGNLLSSSFFGQKDRIVIRNGIDTDIFNLNTSQAETRLRMGCQPTRHLILGAASVWTKRKGFHDFIKLRNLLSEDEFEIMMIGLTKKQIDELPQGIKGICRTNDIHEMAEIYSAADVFVNPTYEDTFPTTNLEALACGTPVVTYDTGGSPEAIDSETGAVVEQGNVRQLKDAVIQICQADGDSYRQKCRARAVSLFDKRDRYQDYLRLYDNILSGK